MSRLRWILLAVSLVAALVVVAVAPWASAAGTRYATTPTSSGIVNPVAVPLGDGYVSTRPRIGYVDSCVTNFSGGGGSQVDGPWIDTARHTWDMRTKLAVNGRVHWSGATYHVAVEGGRRIIKFNDLPIDHPSGVFPIATSDPAYHYDRNPNRIAAHNLRWSLPRSPKAARAPHCANLGPIGVLEDGVVLYDALDALGRDAGAHEVLDLCAAHPDPSDTYHHHDVPACILNRVHRGTTRLVGYALDGYGIYVVKNRRGQLPGNRSLDACHGTTSRVLWNGRLQRVYHYVATLEYPYDIGCFHGTPVSSGVGGPGGAP